jgi:serine/threonine protein kinase
MTVGDKLGHYEIVGPLGSGGMGTVYRARDPRLNREVAVKVLPEGGNQARFQAEARALAALSHPNIVAVYDIGENYIVTELVEGAPLKAAGIRQATDLIAQAADGLSAAHAAGIFHRDIKPHNLLVTAEGRVKVIDFGLAKDSTRGPESKTLTADGTVLGTAPYMSPEQIRGQPIDARSDLFSLGVVLYEQLAGRRPFQGETVAVVMAAVLNQEPEDLPDRVPTGLKHVVYRCLAKDKAARFQNAADLSFALRALGHGSSAGLLHSISMPFSRRGNPRLAWTVAGILALAAAVGWMRRGPAIQAPAARFVVASPQEIPNSNNAGSAISPDGTKLAFVGLSGGSHSIFVRSLDSLEARVITGTTGAQRPFWSADGKSIGYFSSQKLMRVDLAGGAPRALCSTGAGRGGTWNRDGVILFSSGGIGGSVLRRIPASGGEPVAVTEFDAERNEDAHYYPQFLPDGKTFLYFRRTADRIRSGVYLGRLDDPKRGRNDKLLVETQYRAVYAPGRAGGKGHLLYMRGGSLLARAMDPASGQFAGEPALIANEVLVIGANSFADFSASDGGIISYAAGGPLRRLLSWRDRAGKVTGKQMDFIDAAGMVLSPDSRQMVYAREDAEVGSSLWIFNLERNTNSRLMFDGPASFAAWSPDSRKIAFGSRNSIYVMPADGSSGAQKLIDTESPPRPEHWSADGKYLIFGLRSKETENDLWMLPLTAQGTAQGKPAPVVQSKASDIWGTVSPDGKWLSYASSETGQGEVYIQCFPESKSRWMVSVNGGVPYGWRRDGKEFLFRAADGALMAVSIETGESGLRAGPPVELFRRVPLNTQMSRDAQRFLTLDPPGDEVRRPIVVLMNWQK